DKRAPDWEQDMRAGRDVIAARADSLARFMQAYARLARLPQPTLAPCELAPLLRRIAGLETRLAVTLVPGPAITISCDAAQIEQLVINLLKNAVDAVQEQRAASGEPATARLGWLTSAAYV